MPFQAFQSQKICSPFSALNLSPLAVVKVHLHYLFTKILMLEQLAAGAKLKKIWRGKVEIFVIKKGASLFKGVVQLL